MSFFPRSTPPSIAPLPGNGCRSSLPDERFEDEVNCPSCKISSMAAMTSGEVEVDRCRTCGAAWFDPGEIRELTQGRLSAGGDPAPADDLSRPPGEGRKAALRRAWDEAPGLSCPRCDEPLRPADFELMGVPVFRCRRCGGMLLSTPSVAAFAGEKQVPARPRGALRSPRNVDGGRGPTPGDPPARPLRRKHGPR